MIQAFDHVLAEQHIQWCTYPNVVIVKKALKSYFTKRYFSKKDGVISNNVLRLDIFWVSVNHRCGTAQFREQGSHEIYKLVDACDRTEKLLQAQEVNINIMTYLAWSFRNKEGSHYKANAFDIGRFTKRGNINEYIEQSTPACV